MQPSGSGAAGHGGGGVRRAPRSGREDRLAMTAPNRILESMSTAVVVLDAEHRVAALNPAAEALLRTSARRSVGLPLARLVRGDDCTVLAGRAAAGGRACVERNVRLGDRLVDCTATPLGGEEEAAEGRSGGGVILEMANVEHHRRMSREGRRLTENESVEAVIRGLAHEIRNPLGGLRGAAQLLEREIEGAAGGNGPADRMDQSELREYTGIIISEADRLSLLVDRLLTPEASAAPPEPLNVHRVTEHVCALVEAEAVPRQVVIARDYDPSIPALLGSFDHLVQAVLNVVRNAVHAHRSRVRIRTRVAHQAHVGRCQHALAVRIDVIDDGAGVPPDVAESIFYPMVSGHAGGSGLGLSIAQSLVSRHGGILEYAREAGETVFSILLPIVSAAPAAPAPAPAALSITSVTPPAPAAPPLAPGADPPA